MQTSLYCHRTWKYLGITGSLRYCHPRQTSIFHGRSRTVLGKRGQSLAMLTSTVTTELVMLERRVFSAAVRLGRHISSGRPLRGRNQSALDPAAWTALLRPDYDGTSPQKARWPV